MESLKGEFLKDAVETSDRIEMMNSRLLILSVENSELKTKLRLGENYEYSSPYSRHRNVEEEYEVEDEGENDGARGRGEKWYEEGMSVTRHFDDSVSFDVVSMSSKKGSVSVQSEGRGRGSGSGGRRVIRPIVIDSFSVSTGGRLIGQRHTVGQGEGEGGRELAVSRGLYIETSRDSDVERGSASRGRDIGDGTGDGGGGRQSVDARERVIQREREREERDKSRLGELNRSTLRRDEMEVEESITESLTRASAIINSIRDAARHTPSHPTAPFSTGTGNDTSSPARTPPKTHTPTAVLIDRQSLLVAVEALSEEIKLAQLQVCTALSRTLLHCHVLYCTVPYSTALSRTLLHCHVLYCTVTYSTALSRTLLHCPVLYCTVT
jgi:hypothetical protein